jgi:small-conductance mechanosensitive channel
MDTTNYNDKLQSIKTKAINFAPTLLTSIIIFILFYVVAEYVKNYIKSHEGSNLISPEQIILDKSIQSKSKMLTELNKNLIFYQLGKILYYGIIITGIIFALVNLGFNVGTILTLLGTVGLAVGLALQDTLKNIISGIYIAVSSTFQLGDIISLRPLGNTNSTVGQVIDFNLYFTSLIDVKTNEKTIIPNSMLQNNLITNLSKTI